MNGIPEGTLNDAEITDSLCQNIEIAGLQECEFDDAEEGEQDHDRKGGGSNSLIASD